MLDLTGKRFNKLTVIKPIVLLYKKGPIKGWECVCDCGGIVKTSTSNLTRGNTKSCGCTRKGSKENHGNRIHGRTHTSEYNIWRGMIKRCYLKTDKDFLRYGGRGITVCERWKDSFTNFFEDMGLHPENTTLDRVKNDREYSPENCRWTTAKEQANNRRDNSFVRINGMVITQAKLIELLGIRKYTFYNNLKRGLTPNQIYDKFMRRDKNV